jgi:hypothetical protein
MLGRAHFSVAFKAPMCEGLLKGQGLLTMGTRVQPCRKYLLLEMASALR